MDIDWDDIDIQIFKKDVYLNATLWDNFLGLIIVPTEDGIHAVNPNIGSGEIMTKSKDIGENRRLN